MQVRSSVKAKCIGIGAAGAATAVLLLAVGLVPWGLTALACTLAALVLVIAVDIRDAVRRQHVQQMQALREMAYHVILSQHASRAITDVLPGAYMPLSPFSMIPANQEVLLDILRMRKPTTVVELGSGVSTLLTAAWFKREGKGRIVSFDHEESWAARCRMYLELQGLADWAEVRDAPLGSRRSGGQEYQWYQLDGKLGDLPEIDLLVVDGPPAGDWQPLARVPALDAFYSRIVDGGTVLLDDGDRPGERETVNLWLRACPGLKAEFKDTLSGCWVLTKAAAVEPSLRR